MFGRGTTFRLGLVASLATAGCVDDWCDRFSIACETGSTPYRDVVDEDGDVWSATLDCDDRNPAVHPGAEEVCDGYDNDCDGDVDEGTPGIRPFYEDADGDGYGNPGRSTTGCDGPAGWVENGEDCNDMNAAINPMGTETCDDLDWDEDCDGLSDDEDPDVSYTWWDREQWRDADGDGFGNAEISFGQLCDPDAPGMPSMVDNNLDCDDSDPDIHPDATERWYDGWDQDCDAGSDYDADGDGQVALEWGGADCDDADATTAAGAAEVCDGIDHDCDGTSCGAVSLDDATAYVLGDVYDGQLGGVISALDLDLDGRTEIVLGVSQVDRVAAFDLDLSSGVTLSDAITSVAPDHGGVDFGAAVAGDLDIVGEDDLADLVVGAPLASTGLEGAVYVYGGPISGAWDAEPDIAIAGSASGGQVGAAIALLADDPDGLVLAVGAPGLGTLGANTGGVFLLAGPLSGTRILADSPFIGGRASTDLAGSALAPAGDVDGDGLGDLLVGAYGSDVGGTNAGTAYVVLGPLTDHGNLGSTDFTVHGAASSDLLGTAVAAVGDLDGDGLADIAIGAPGAGSGRPGEVLVFTDVRMGTWAATGATVILSGETSGDDAGMALAGGSDLDGDGAIDLVIGAPDHMVDGARQGAAYVFGGPWSGSVSLARSSVKLVGDRSRDLAGIGLAVLPDRNDDGVDEIIVGATGSDGIEAMGGAAYVVDGASW